MAAAMAHFIVEGRCAAAADQGDLSPFILFIAKQLIETEQSVLQDLRSNS